MAQTYYNQRNISVLGTINTQRAGFERLNECRNFKNESAEKCYQGDNCLMNKHFYSINFE